MNDSVIEWPPCYSIRHSKRAKYLKLHLDAEAGLILVLPRGVSERSGVRFLHSKRAWIEKHWPRLLLQRSKPVVVTAPHIVCLPLLQRQWQIEYAKTPVPFKRHELRPKADRLLLSCADSEMSVVIALLKSWLKRTAKRYLTPLMQEISDNTGLKYNKLSFRHQKTLWASCSCQHNISLNVKLLFMPLQYVKYVMIHELCHTLHMDHSKQFWRCVSRFEPNYLMLDKEINRIQTAIPDWYDHRLHVQHD